MGNERPDHNAKKYVEGEDLISKSKTNRENCGSFGWQDIAQKIKATDILILIFRVWGSTSVDKLKNNKERQHHIHFFFARVTLPTPKNQVLLAEEGALETHNDLTENNEPEEAIV